MGEALHDRYERPAAVLLAHDAFPEVAREAQLCLMKFLGGVAVRGESGVLPSPEANNESSLMAAVQLAALGDPEAMQVVETNTATEVSERLFKVAHQSTVKLRMQNDRLGQNGRLMLDLHRNALEQTELIPEMVRRSSHEARNILLFESLYKRRIMDDYDMIVFSPSSTTMTEAEKKDYRFFTDTESVSIQRLSADGEEVTLETAFVAGKKTPESERHDVDTIQTMAANLGIQLSENDGTDLIRQVFLIPKQQIEGVEDIVALYDAAAGGTFYGQAKSPQNYKLYAQECQRRSDNFANTVADIRSQLIAEAATFKTPLEAFMRLDALSEAACTERAVFDPTIDLSVFGKTAANHIIEARQYHDLGQFELFTQSLQRAIETGESSSCPIKRSIVSGGDGSPEGASGGGSNQEVSKKQWMTCPHCKAKVFGDPCASRLECWDCIALVSDGVVISTGNGGSRKRREERAKKGNITLMSIILQGSPKPPADGRAAAERPPMAASQATQKDFALAA